MQKNLEKRGLEPIQVRRVVIVPDSKGFILAMLSRVLEAAIPPDSQNERTELTEKLITAGATISVTTENESLLLAVARRALDRGPQSALTSQKS